MKFKPPVNLVWSPELAYFIGVLQGDGSISIRNDERGFAQSAKLSIAVGHNDLNYAKFLKRLAKKLFKCTVSLYNDQSAHRVEIFRRDIIRALDPYKRSMTLPKEVAKSTALARAYLRGLFDTDGCCTIRGFSGAVDFSNSDTVLIKDVEEILEKFGIKFNTRSLFKGDYNPTFRVTITNKTNIGKYAASVGFAHPRKRALLRKLSALQSKFRTRQIRGEGWRSIAQILSKHEELTANEIAKSLNLHRETVKEHLEKMMAKDLIRRRVEFYNRWGIINRPSCKRYYWRLNRNAKLSERL